MKVVSHASRLVFGVALNAMVLTVAARAADPMDPRGLWLHQEAGVQFSFYDCGTGLLCGKVIGAVHPADRAGIGTVILRGAKEVAASEWRGTLYNTKDGKSSDGYISVRSSGELSIKSCLMGFLCDVEIWTRLPSPTHAAPSKGTPTVAVAAVE